MNPQQIMRTGITASAVAHLSVLALVLFFSEVHPFGSVAAEPIAVDLVSPAEVVQAPESKVEPLPVPTQKASDASDCPAKTGGVELHNHTGTPPRRRRHLPRHRKSRRRCRRSNLTGKPPSQSKSRRHCRPRSRLHNQLHNRRRNRSVLLANPPETSPLPAIIPAAPDLSLKYHVLLGLPQDNFVKEAREMPAIDAMASTKADVASNLVAEFRRHLKTCSTLPSSIAPSDTIKLKLRVFMTPEGRLATDPVLLEASASAKGPALMQSAISALQACQPYAMLPADRYGEWKVLDLGFTPQDFTGG